MTDPPPVWLPLSARLGEPFDTGLYEGVPPHMEEPVRQWILRAVGSDQYASRLQMRLRLPGDMGNPARNTLAAVDEEKLLDVVDAIIAFGSDTDPIARYIELVEL